MIVQPTLIDTIADGQWLAHRYDEQGDEIQFRFFDREQQRAVTFLTDEALGDAPIAVFRRAECLEASAALRLPLPGMIFHSAYCCSTLLARAFDIPRKSFGLKEPQILNDVVGLQLRRGDPRQVAAAADVSLALLARPLAPGEMSIIKPSNLLNPLIPLIAALRPGLRALTLYAPLDVFLASIANKGIEGRAWVRELMWKLINLGQAQRFGFTDEDLYRQTDLQVAAIGWLTQQAIFADMLANQPEWRSLDSETLIARPRECIEALGELFALDVDAEAIAGGTAFQRHSKDQTEFSAKLRVEQQQQSMKVHAREIEIVLDWSRRISDQFGIPFDLPAPLVQPTLGSTGAP